MLKVFEFAIKVKGYGTNVDEALCEAFEALEDNAAGTVDPDIVYEELPPDARCEKFSRTLSVLMTTAQPWDGTVGTD